MTEAARPDLPSPSERLGLTSKEAADRRAISGPNQIGMADDEPLWKELLESLTEPLQLILIAVAVLYAILGELRDAAIIFGVIVTVAGVETWTERRAGRAIATLSKLSAPKALAWRDGKLAELPPENLVPGDVVVLTAGSRVPADGRLIEADELLVDESLVTGESQPVEHGVGEAEQGAVKAGTNVVRGRGSATITAVGRDSTLGRISELIRGAEAQRTPLQNQIKELARGLLVAALAISVVVPTIGVLRGQPLHQMILSGLTLAFATIPEELPILVVIVLGLGSLRLAHRGAIVRRLIAAETLGATTLICTDKTGTLTENRMALTSVLPASAVGGGSDGESRAADDLVKRFARLASEPPAGGGARFVDPMDIAVWQASEPDWPEPETRFSFDSSRRLASGLARVDGRLLAGVKGAPEAVLNLARAWRTGSGVEELNDETRAKILEAGVLLARDGGRVLAVGSRMLSARTPGGRDEVERELDFEGFLVFSDPLRPEVPGAVSELEGAGVAITVVTGDQPSTAAAIAQQAGIRGAVYLTSETANWSDQRLAAVASQGAVFARARPEDKLRIVRAAQAAGEVVAVTGDGVNDAPALQAAAIGVAMGRVGSDVAREAADLVLTDDNFATLARATAEGRRLYENLRKAVRYYLAVKVALITVTFVAAVSGLPLPFAPVQIVILELFMDLGASVAFVNQAAEADEMRRPPRDPRARFLDRSMLLGIVAGGLTLALISGGAFFWSLPALGVDAARTLALASWMVGHAVLGIVMGWERRPVSLPDLVGNPAMLGWAGAAAAFALAIVLLPAFGGLLHARQVPPGAAGFAIAAAVLVPLWMELSKRLWRA